MAWVEAVLGVPCQPGGRHERMGTHNALLSLGHDTYLEVIAVDPRAHAPGRARWFGLDERPPGVGPGLVTWVARVSDVDRIAADSPEPIGEVVASERGPFAWRITVPTDGRLALDGLVPSLITWWTERPGPSLTDRGCRLGRLEARHPEVDRLGRALKAFGMDDDRVRVTGTDGRPSLLATIMTPTGERWIGAPVAIP